MTREEKMAAFVWLGKAISGLDEPTLTPVFEKAQTRNNWFTPQNCRTALTGVSYLLDAVPLARWMSQYPEKKLAAPKTVALVLAGNIPLVGFHDVLTVLMSGHRAMIKLSSKDDQLLPFVMDMLIGREARFQEFVLFTDRLKNFDAVIATGSDNSARYFDYYFSKYPSIIRKNRTSCAVLTGRETAADLTALGNDVFQYFGLGCRNVAKLFVPEGYDFVPLLENWKQYETVQHHHKYFNNYEYQKAIMLVNGSVFMDNGVAMLTENERMVSPISVVYYETYANDDDLARKIALAADKIQCVVGAHAIATVPFGFTQRPGPADYADGIDTMNFLCSLN